MSSMQAARKHAKERNKWQEEKQEKEQRSRKIRNYSTLVKEMFLPATPTNSSKADNEKINRDNASLPPTAPLETFAGGPPPLTDPPYQIAIESSSPTTPPRRRRLFQDDSAPSTKATPSPRTASPSLSLLQVFCL